VNWTRIHTAIVFSMLAWGEEDHTCIAEDEAAEQLLGEAANTYYSSHQFVMRLHLLCGFLHDSIWAVDTNKFATTLIRDITIIITADLHK
jgi:hypothetical protein